ncbi:transposase [Streptomyces sp. SPB78]|nr:transposase [Streptomyces sp. SPB78]
MARTGRPKAELVLSDEERAALEGWVRRRSTPQAWALRCRIILASASGASNKDVAAQLGATPHAVGRWRKRFVEHRIAGLGDMPRPGGPRTVTDEQVAAVVKRTLESAPKSATHWSTRAMAREMGLSQSTVSRIWRAFGLQPHRTETFKLSTDPYFIDKVHDVVGLYLDPPERALVFCVDEEEPDPSPGQVPAGAADDARGPAADHPRLRARRNHHPVRRPGGGHGEGDRLPAPPAPGRGVQEVPDQTRPGDTGGPGRAPGAGQLRHPQDPGHQDMAADSHPLPPALHAHRIVLAQPGRAVVRGADQQADTARRPQERPGPGEGHPLLDRRVEHRSQALRVDQDCERDPRTPRQLSEQNS